MSDQHDLLDETAEDEARARREFLKKCGKYAVVVPPAMALLLTRDANAGNAGNAGNAVNYIECELVPLSLCSTTQVGGT